MGEFVGVYLDSRDDAGLSVRSEAREGYSEDATASALTIGAAWGGPCQTRFAALTSYSSPSAPVLFASEGFCHRQPSLSVQDSLVNRLRTCQGRRAELWMCNDYVSK